MSTALYNVLSGLHKSDTLLSTTITTLSGKLSPAFTNSKLSIGAGSGITASNYSLPTNDQVASGSFGAASTVASEKNVQTYVEGKIAAANGAAISGATINYPLTGNVTQEVGGKKLTIGIAVDDKTVKVVNNALSASYQLSATTTATGFASTYALVDGGGVSHGTINIPKDQFLKDAKFGYATNGTTGAGWNTTRGTNNTIPTLKLTFELDHDATTDGDQVDVFVNMQDLVKVYTAGNGISISSDVISLDLKAVSGAAFNGVDTISAQINTTANDGFLKNSANGLYTSGIQDAITAATSTAVSATTAFSTTSGILIATGSGRNAQDSKVTIATTIGSDNTTVPTSKAVKDHTANMVTSTANLTSGNLVKAAGNNKAVTDAGVAVETTLTNDNAKLPTSKAVSSFVGTKLGTYVEGPSASVNLNIAQFDGTNGKKIKDSGKAFTDDAVTSSASGNTSVPTNAAIWKTVSGLVTGPASATGNNFAMFDGNTGKAIKDSTVSLQKSTDTNGTTLSSDDKIPTAKAISGYIATQTANYVVPSGTGFALNEIAIFADNSGKKIATSDKSFSTAAITSGSTDAQIPTAKAVHAAISGFLNYTGEIQTGDAQNWEVAVIERGGYEPNSPVVGFKNSKVQITTAGTYGMTGNQAAVGVDISENPDGKEYGTHGDEYYFASDDDSIPTAGAVKAYMYGLFDSPSLTTLEGNINALNTAITNLNS